jgi:hypothetical protein
VRVLHDPSGIAVIPCPGIRDLVRQRWVELIQDVPDDPILMGEFIVVEPGDRLGLLMSCRLCPKCDSEMQIITSFIVRFPVKIRSDSKLIYYQFQGARRKTGTEVPVEFY